MTFSAVCLCGGRSRRMGRDKARLEIDGEPLVLRQVKLLRQLEPAQLYISISAESSVESPPGVPTLLDRWEGQGPLGAIATALETCATSHTLFLAVDMPGMSVAVMRRLLDGCGDQTGSVPRINGNPEPLAAVYPREALSLAVTALNQGRRAARGFAEECSRSGLATWMEIPANEASAFKNWNSPADLPPE